MPCFGKSRELREAQQRNQDQQNAVIGLTAELEACRQELAQAQRESSNLHASAHDVKLQCETLREDLRGAEEEAQKARAETKTLRDKLCQSVPSADFSADVRTADPCKRAISLGDLTGFFSSHCGTVEPICMPLELSRACTEWNQSNRSIIMRGEVRMLTPNTYAVDHLIISKLTKDDKISLAELWHQDGLLAEVFVSHWWGQDFGEVCQSIFQLILQRASRLHPGLNQQDIDALVRSVALWMSVFSCNRWNLRRELGDAIIRCPVHTVLEAPSTKELMLCIDTSVFVLQRAWCCAELVIACGFKKGLLFATRFGSLHQIAADTVPCSLFISHLALSLESIEMRTTIASCAHDFDMIKKHANETGMDDVNSILQRSLAEVLLPLAARAGDVSSITTLLEKRAGPDVVDWRGIYALTHGVVVHGESSNTVQTLLRHGADRRALAKASDVMRMFDEDFTTRERALQLMKELPMEERTFHTPAIEAAEAEFANVVANSTLAKTSLEDPRQKEEALKRLGRLGDKAAHHISAISLCLFDEHPAIRSAAHEVLVGTGEDITTHVVHHLKDKEGGIRAAAVELLGKSVDAAVPHVGVVAELLTDDEWKVRKAACETLGAVGEHSAAHVGSVANCLADDHGDVRTAALWSLGKFGTLSAPYAGKIADCLGDELIQVRVAAREVLEKRKT